MSYEITIAFSKNHEMTWPCDGKTIEEAQELAETIRTKYPEAKVTIESRENIFD
jgi:isocitrate lyase